MNSAGNGRILIGMFSIGVVSLLMLTSCRSAYYAAWEKFGVYKRDLLKKRVVEARDEQKAAGEQFKDAMTRLKELYAFEGGQLEKNYNSLNGEYEDCVTRANAVHKRISEMETVAADLFKEWEKEIAQISTPSLQEGSLKQLKATRERYNSLHQALKKAEESMTPVLTQFKDHVLYLKHNLNAQAISSLKGEATSIQTEISRLLTEMNSSIAKADEFIKTLQ
jgi:chromosome segregation ATPase